MTSIGEESKCQYNYLGRSGLRVANICLGAFTFGKPLFGTPGNLDEASSHDVIRRYVEWGGNFIDIADIYSFGESEKIVGSWLATQERDRYVIATKVRFQTDSSNPNAMGLSRRHITRAIEDSLGRLKTDYVDLYQTHVWDDATPLEETLLTLNDLVRCGKVRYLGASNMTGWQMQKVVELTKQMGLNPFISLQQQYSLLDRESEVEPFVVCRMNGVGVLPWSPLKGGFLTGKYTRGPAPQENTRLAHALKAGIVDETHPQWADLNTDSNWALIDGLQNIAAKKGKTVAQISIRWLLQRPVVTSVIIGVSKLHQLDDNMGAANAWELTAQEMAELDELSRPKVGNPYKKILLANLDRKNPWNPNGLQ
ncbi:hypothetical protein BaRGS_00031764 [Batillaria attramentaria]|uniref:NADP-dependent oxidoreductase domain-containing protein n=1 Tax=Batillaria attramentaria TaxID=370345 RepID=A0ABD0JQ73_9CAEN